MLRTRAVDVSLWEAVLPPEVLRLPDELARVDALLDDSPSERRAHPKGSRGDNMPPCFGR